MNVLLFAAIAALLVDLPLIAVAGSPSGWSRAVGPLRIRLHDPSLLLAAAAILSGIILAASWARPRARGWALAGIAAAAACAATAAVGGARHVVPLGDIAVLEMYVRNAAHGQLMVGPYSRFGWHHPGPLYFYVVSPIYALGRQQPAALSAGAASLAIGTMAALTWIAQRAYGQVVSAAILASVVSYLWRVPDLLVSAWNPHVVILPTIALLVAGAATLAGSIVLFPVVVALASFIVQTDVAVLPVAATIVGLCSVAVVWTPRTHRYASINAALWLALAFWFVPLAEQLTHAPGNMTRLWRFFVDDPARGQSLSVAAGAWGSMLAMVGRLNFSLASGGTFAADRPVMSLTFAIAQLAGLAFVFVRCMRRGRQHVAALALVALTASLVALWSATRIQDRVMDHEVFWQSALGVLNLGVLAAAVLTESRWVLTASSLMPSMIPAGANSFLIAVALLLCFGQIGRARDGRLPVTLTSPAAERLADSVRYYTAEKGGRPLVRIGEDVWGTAAGVLLELDRTGVAFSVEENWMPMFPQSFASTGDESMELAFSDTDEHGRLSARTGNVLVANAGPVYVDAAPIDRRRAR